MKIERFYMKKNNKLIIAGVGGQGVVFLSRLFAEVALQAGDALISYESHGMAMRGGSVSCHLKIGGFQSPIIAGGEADILLVLAKTELPNVQHLLSHSGLLFINSEIKPPNIDNSQVATIPASSMAVEQKLTRAVNLIAAGFALAHAGFPYSVEQFHSALERMPVNKKIRAANIAALNLGYNKGKTS